MTPVRSAEVRVPRPTKPLLLLACAMALRAVLPDPNPLSAQSTVELCPEWLATVDESSQQIVLRWRPSPTRGTLGYHICTGTPCLDYDTVYGRTDTSYICIDHSPLEAHVYRLHVFDSLYNVSALTPSFGNMALQADIPACSTDFTASWNPCTGMSASVERYDLMMLAEPLDTDYRPVYTALPSDPTACTLSLPEEATGISLKVVATLEGGLASQSNIVGLRRRTADTASHLRIAAARYDTLAATVGLRFDTDTTYHAAPYGLYRHKGDGEWRLIAPSVGAQYTDTDIGYRDTLCCYRLAVADACGLAVSHSEPVCLRLPDPEQPAVWLPNTLVAGDPANSRFLPLVKGLRDDLYELHIYNRQGLLVHATTNPADGWDATEAPQGVYTYSLRLSLGTGQVRTYTGTVTVIQ